MQKIQHYMKATFTFKQSYYKLQLSYNGRKERREENIIQRTNIKNLITHI